MPRRKADMTAPPGAVFFFYLFEPVAQPSKRALARSRRHVMDP